MEHSSTYKIIATAKVGSIYRVVLQTDLQNQEGTVSQKLVFEILSILAFILIKAQF